MTGSEMMQNMGRIIKEQNKSDLQKINHQLPLILSYAEAMWDILTDDQRKKVIEKVRKENQ